MQALVITGASPGNLQLQEVPMPGTTHVLPLADWEQGFKPARSGEAIKVVSEP